MPTGLWKRVIDVFAPAHVVEFFATTDGQAVLANVSGAKMGSKGRALPGGGEVELAAYDPEDDLILEDERGFVRKADTNEVGVLLAHPHGPVDPTRPSNARVRRCRHLGVDRIPVPPRRGRRLLAGRQPCAVIHTPRGPVYGSPINDAVGRLGAVDLAVTYGVEVDGRQLAITALALCPGGQHSVGGSVRSTGRSARRQPARHCARGAGD